MDKITLDGLAVTACHGLLDFERTSPQPFVVDLALWGDFAAVETDGIGDTVDYGEAARVAAEIVENNSFFLIERLAGEIAGALLGRFELLRRVGVRVHKPKAPIGRPFGDVSVYIERGRDRE